VIIICFHLLFSKISEILTAAMPVAAVRATTKPRDSNSRFILSNKNDFPVPADPVCKK
jgi:hypothetical protein